MSEQVEHVVYVETWANLIPRAHVRQGWAFAYAAAGCPLRLKGDPLTSWKKWSYTLRMWKAGRIKTPRVSG